MAQLVNIAITDETGKVRSRFDINFAPILQRAWEEGESKYPWITAIDEYGNTYINTRQARYISKELQSLHEVDKLQSIIKVRELLDNLETHTLLAFFGD